MKTSQLESDDSQTIFRLPDSGYSELALCIMLALLATVDHRAGYTSEIFSLDSSLRRGGTVKTDLPAGTVRQLWLSRERKGGYTSLNLSNFFDVELARLEAAPAVASAPVVPEKGLLG